MRDVNTFLIWAFVVPLVLLSLSAFQEMKALKSMAGEARYVARLNQDVPVLEALQEKNPIPVQSLCSVFPSGKVA